MNRDRLAGALAALFWVVFGITLVIRLMAGDGGLLASEMLRAAPPAVSGLPEQDYPGVGAMTAEYLTGKRESFQYVSAQGTVETACRRVEVFQEHEAAHMADCRGLIRLDTVVCVCCGAAAAALTAAGWIRKKGREAFLRGILTGLRIAAAAAVAMGIWALVNFDGLFVTFHRVAFRNDGWLLNPRTDLLIRLMPEKFFVRLGIIGAAWALVIPVLLDICARIALGRMRKQ